MPMVTWRQPEAYNVLSATCRPCSTLDSGRKQSAALAPFQVSWELPGRPEGAISFCKNPLPSVECILSPTLPSRRVPPEHQTRLGRWKPMRLQSPAHTVQHKSSFRAGSRIPSGVRRGGNAGKMHKARGKREDCTKLRQVLTLMRKHAEVGFYTEKLNNGFK